MELPDSDPPVVSVPPFPGRAEKNPPACCRMEETTQFFLSLPEVMRKLAIIALLLACTSGVLAATYRVEEVPNVQQADRRRYVSNPDGILSDRTVMRLDSLCGALRERGIAQVAVVAVDDIAGGDTFLFAVDLFRRWGVGRAGTDNGLGVLLVRDLHEIRFVTGGGLEGVLTDALCKRIQMKYMLPYFREENYDAGMTAGLQAVAQLLEGSDVDLGLPEGADDELPGWFILLIVAGVVGIPVLVSVWSYYARRRCPRCRRLTLELRSQQVVSLTFNSRVVEYTYICKHCGEVVRRRVRSLRDDHFGGGGGGPIIGGFGGGGFGGGSFGGGGFGGGSFGGGGAGSKW